ncbi:hypothetical protein PM082_008959 [Marasmius tenuissimus]|nr:hypothetical protein PM082_008959 [Marasmius tenuissimus]
MHRWMRRSLKGLSLDDVDGEGEIRRGGWIKIDSSDTSVNYLNGSLQWQDIGGGFNGTGKTSGTVQIKLNGTSISFFSFLEGSNATQPWSSSPARYHIDDAQDTSFTIPASKKMSNGQVANFQNQLLFNASDLSGDKKHELAITYEGVYDSDEPPIQWLFEDYFLVTPVGMVSTSSGKSKPAMRMILGAAFGGAGVVGGRTSMTSYPPEKQRYSNMSTCSSAPFLGGVGEQTTTLTT